MSWILRHGLFRGFCKDRKVPIEASAARAKPSWTWILGLVTKPPSPTPQPPCRAESWEQAAGARHHCGPRAPFMKQSFGGCFGGSVLIGVPFYSQRFATSTVTVAEASGFSSSCASWAARAKSGCVRMTCTGLSRDEQVLQSPLRAEAQGLPPRRPTLSSKKTLPLVRPAPLAYNNKNNNNKNNSNNSNNFYYYHYDLMYLDEPNRPADGNDGTCTSLLGKG